MELLELYLSPLNATHYQAIATRVPEGLGDSNSECILPFWENGKDWRPTIIKMLESSQGFRSNNFPEQGEQDWMEHKGFLLPDRQTFNPTYLSQIGQALYQSLFPPDSAVKQTLNSALRLTEQRQADLHLRLKFPADSVERSRLADYPWELLHDGQRFLLHQRVRLSRYIAYDASPPSLPVQDTVRVWLVSARPKGLPQLPIEEQQAVQLGLQQAQDAGLVQLRILPVPTRKALSRHLTDCPLEERPHVLHFDGHGVFGKRCTNSDCLTIHPGIKAKSCKSCGRQLPSPQGYLVFETEQGEPDYQSATQVAALLQPYSIALVVLSACQSGMAVAGDSAFNGMAQSLIDQRIPSVVAMQYSIRADAACEFAEQFYRELGNKKPLLAAVNRGLREMDGQRNVEGNQWYRPVLYLRWQDNQGGQLFKESQARVDSGERLEPVSSVPSTRASKFPKWLKSRASIGILTGTGITAVVLFVRLLRFLEPMELSLYDHLLRLRPSEGHDNRITIIEATTEDLKAQRDRHEPGMGTISDQALKDVLQVLSQDDFKPAIIVLDLYRDFGRNEPLLETFQALQEDPDVDLFVACEQPNTENEKGVEAPLEETIPSNRVGFSNFILDKDGVLRRQLIELRPKDLEHPCQIEQSLSLQVALRYLEKHTNQQFVYNDLWTSSGDLILNGAKLERINTYAFGGYQYVDARAVQFLLNYRAPNENLSEITQQPIRLEAVRDGKISAEYFKNQIVLIGITDRTEAVDYKQTPYGETAGVIIQAHMISQLISVALGERSLIWVCPQWGETGWIFLWGIAGGFFGAYIKSRRMSFVLIVVGSAIIWGITAGTMMQSGWLPLLPPILALACSGITANYLCQEPNLSQKRLNSK